MHYLDDFHTLSPPGSKVRQSNLDRSIDYLSTLDIPLHPKNLEGPSTCLTILCIILDSVTLQERLPQMFKKNNCSAGGVVSKAFL